MDNFYIVANSSKIKAVKIAVTCQDILKEFGKNSYIHNQDILYTNPNSYKYKNTNDIPENTECVIVIGGDGTMLRISRDLVEKDLPLLGVNLGTMGYLMDTELKDLRKALKNICEDKYKIEERMLIDGTLYNEYNKTVLNNIALNDIVIARDGSLKLNDIDVYVNDCFLHKYAADGIIVATPTGSTGYSMSAGGPIVSPSSELILLTPVCSHDITSKSIVLSRNDKVTIKIPKNRRGYDQKLKLYFDCDKSVSLMTSNYIEIKKSNKSIKLIKFEEKSFMEILQQKMN